MPETSSPIMEPTASSGSAVTAGMPPARETTSGRLTTENSARISDVFIPCVRAAYRSASGSRRGWRGTAWGCAPCVRCGPGGRSDGEVTSPSVRRGGNGKGRRPSDLFGEGERARGRIGLGGQEQALHGRQHALRDGTAHAGVEQQEPVDRVGEVPAV